MEPENVGRDRVVGAGLSASALVSGTWILQGHTGPALVVDQAGVVRDGNRQAAELLGRSLEELRGALFGLTPRDWVRIELDVISSDGVRRTIAVRSVPGGEGYSILELEDLGQKVESVAAAIHAALADLHALMPDRHLGVTIGPSLALPAPSALRPALTTTLRSVIEMFGRRKGELTVTSEWRGDFISIEVWVERWGSLEIEPFAKAVEQVRQLGGFVRFEPGANGGVVELSLELPHAPAPL